MRDGQESFGALLRRYRLGAALTQEELSALTGLSVRAISSMEAGRTARPYPRSVQLLADALGLSEDSRAALLNAAKSESHWRQAIRPAQLPPDIAEFTGRARQLGWLADLLTGNNRAARVVAITGTGGVGKSALAVHVGHRVRDAFPDGQLFVEMQGSGDQPTSTAEALARLLRHLGMTEATIPADITERAAEFRTRMAGLSMLLILDDARDAAQVRALLPGTVTSAVLVTSRGWLADLEGCRILALSALGEADARALFASLCGPDRVAAEMTATDVVLSACGGLPLAIRIAAARLVSRPTWSIGALASRLGSELHRLEELAVGDLAVRASFQVSYGLLPGPGGSGGDVKRAFRLLGLWSGGDISLAAAAALLGVDRAAASRMLERLVDVHMLEAPAAQRYRFQDLIRVFAAERAVHDEPAASREKAIRRILLWYLHSADAALTTLELAPRPELTLIPADRAAPPLAFAGYDEAADWSDTERDNVVSAVVLASRWDMHQICAQLADVVWRGFKRSPWDGWVQVLEHGLASAVAVGDQVEQAWLHNFAGIALMFRGHHLEAVAHFDEALPLSRDIGSRRCEATATGNVAIAYRALKRYDEAISHLEKAMMIDPDPPRRGRVLVNLGMVYLDQGRLEEGIGSIEEGLALINQAGDHWGDSLSRSLIADAYRQLGRQADAIKSAQRALEISRRVHDEYQEAAALYALGQVLADCGELARARACLTSAYLISDRLGLPMAKEMAASIAALDAGKPG